MSELTEAHLPTYTQGNPRGRLLLVQIRSAFSAELRMFMCCPGKSVWDFFYCLMKGNLCGITAAGREEEKTNSSDNQKEVGGQSHALQGVIVAEFLEFLG